MKEINNPNDSNQLSTNPTQLSNVANSKSIKSNTLPKWGWFVIAAVSLLAVILIVILALPTEPGFTLVVRGAPSGSDVLVDNIGHGVTLPDGTISVTYLKPGKRLVRVVSEGYNEFNTTVAGTAGNKEYIIAQLVALEKKSSLPSEIDYTGKMILIPAGEFILGSDNYLPNEKNAQKTFLPDYYIDKYEVTNSQYHRFCEATNRPMPSNPWWDENYFTNPDMPIVGISWNDAVAYANWAGKRLPSEVEWEKAASWDAKAQKKHLWPWGDNSEPGRANLTTNHPTPINQYTSGASSYGVQDMAGNAAEWVDSYYQPYPNNQIADASYGTTNRVVRGGSFRSSFDDARTTRRFFHTPDFKMDEVKTRSWLIGFRCVVSANDMKLQEFIKAGK